MPARVAASEDERVPGRPEKLHVLVAGGGVAALEAMVALRKLAGELVEVELVSPDADFFYRPLSVAEPFGRGACSASTLPPWRTAAGRATPPARSLRSMRTSERVRDRAATPRSPTTRS